MENLETILSEVTANKLTEEDQLKIKEILSKYQVETNNSEHNLEEPYAEEGFEFPDQEWQDPSDLEFLSEQTQQPEINSEATNSKADNSEATNSNTDNSEAVIKMDEMGQLQLPLEQSAQMEMDLSLPSIETNVVEEKLEKQPIIIDENGQLQLILEDSAQMNLSVQADAAQLPENQSKEKSETINSDTPIITDINGRKEPILSLEGLEGVAAQTATMDSTINNSPVSKFKNFEKLANDSLGKLNNLFNFRDENGKIDWHNQAKKTVLVLKNVKNAALDNKVVNALKSTLVKKYKNSKFGIKTHQIADTITVNLMSREERYNREFKNTIALLGYNVNELIKPTNEPMLTLQEVSDNINLSLKNKLGLELTDNGYQSTLLTELNDEQKVKFIQTIVWPKLTEMMGESMKLFEALKDIKEKNPICKEIAQMAKKNNMEEELFATMLLKSPELLTQKNIKGLDKLLSKKEQIEELYFKNEELFGKNFIVLQNLVKASASIQKTIIGLDISTEDKQTVLQQMKSTVVKSENSKKILFENIQDSVTSSLHDNQFVKSLRNINEKILKMRQTQQKETTKLKM